MGDLSYIEAQVLVEHPGPFQGEEPWVPLAYENMLEGRTNEIELNDSSWISWMQVSESDKMGWYLDESTISVTLTTNNEGFIFGVQLNQQAHDEFLSEIRSNDES